MTIFDTDQYFFQNYRFKLKLRAKNILIFEMKRQELFKVNKNSNTKKIKIWISDLYFF